MAVVEHNVGFTRGIHHGVDASDAVAVDFGPVNRLSHDAVPKHAEAYKGQRDPLGEEDFADGGGNIGKGISDTADDEILEERGALDEGGALLVRRQVALTDQLDGELED